MEKLIVVIYFFCVPVFCNAQNMGLKIHQNGAVSIGGEGQPTQQLEILELENVPAALIRDALNNIWIAATFSNSDSIGIHNSIFGGINTIRDAKLGSSNSVYGGNQILRDAKGGSYGSFFGGQSNLRNSVFGNYAIVTGGRFNFYTQGVIQVLGDHVGSFGSLAKTDGLGVYSKSYHIGYNGTLSRSDQNVLSNLYLKLDRIKKYTSKSAAAADLQSGEIGVVDEGDADFYSIYLKK